MTDRPSVNSHSSAGGAARARKLPASRRSAIAQQAAEARWGSSMHTATHRGVMKIGDIDIECAVLEDRTRLLSQGTVLRALGRHPEKSRRGRGSDGELRAPFLAAQNLQPFISEELQTMSEPIPYRVAGESARTWGYRAEMLPMVCDVYLEAKEAGKIAPGQRGAVRQAGILVRALAKTGIVALVDEATGYQDVRGADDLQRLMETYVRAEFRPWVRAFPEEFFAQIYRLQGWQQRPTSKRPGFVGTLINKYIYEQLPEGVLEELQRVNPRNERGNRRRKHHQHLTPDTGNVHLDRQISTVTTLLRIAHNKREFEELFERAFPPAEQRLPLVIAIPPEEDMPANQAG